MSNARSPREVCSTTIGTSGDMAGQSSYSPGGGFGAAVLGAGSPDLPGAGRFALLATGSPQLLARLGLLDRDRLRVLHDQVDRLAHRDVLAERVLDALGA